MWIWIWTIGVILIKNTLKAEVVMVDHDLLQVCYALSNIEKNNTRNGTPIGWV